MSPDVETIAAQSSEASSVLPSEASSELPPNESAALQLAGRKEMIRFGLPCPKAAEIVETVGAGRSRSFELATEVPGAVSSLVRPRGRPPLEQRPAEPQPDLSRKVIDYLMHHPGCAATNGRRRNYTDGFRCFILELIDDHSELDMPTISAAVGVPLSTLWEWVNKGASEASEPSEASESCEASEAEPGSDQPSRSTEVANARIQTIVKEWERWEGDFLPFCEHLNQNLHIPYGRTMVSSILEKLGLRSPTRRTGRTPDEKAMRQAFETFFPGAQWEGDGSPIVVHACGQSFSFNLELIVDAYTGAVTGISVREAEDGAAVREAFDQAVETTGAPPIVLELDNRPSNHCDEVQTATGETTVMPSSPGRPQSNGHVEGAHGLFQTAAPELSIDGSSLQQIARRVLELVVLAWARTLNHKPRLDRGGRSRAQLYQEDEPTDEQLQQAQQQLRQRCQRQQQAQQTLRARQDPVVRTIIDEQFERLGLDDPTGNIRAAIAGYPLDHVLAALSIYRGKASAGTLPSDVDARYIFGIVRNVSNKDEGLLVTEELLRLRQRARDLMLEPLVEAHRKLLESTTSVDDQLRSMISRAMDSDRQLERQFWLDSAADLIGDQPPQQHGALVRAASRRIHACFSVAYDDRLAAVRLLSRKVVPVE